MSYIILVGTCGREVVTGNATDQVAGKTTQARTDPMTVSFAWNTRVDIREKVAYHFQRKTNQARKEGLLINHSINFARQT